MNFVPGYKHDIFISYARVDDDSDSGDGWVTTLVKKLESQLAEKLGRKNSFSLWMDHQLAGNTPITPEILQTLRNTATIVICLSQGYLASFWCQKEQNNFLQMIQDRLRESSNIFLLELDELERPTEFADLLGYQFWVKDRMGKPPKKLQAHPNDHPAYDQRYYDVLNDLSYCLAEELKRLKKNVEVRSPQELQKAEPSATVFLAEVTHDLQFKREEVRRYLLQQGIRVVPQIEYSLEPTAFQRAVLNDLARSDLFVQLFSEFPDRRPVDLPQGYDRCQYELALQADKQILQWRSPELVIPNVLDNAHQELLQEKTVLAMGFEEFKAEIVKRAIQTETPAPCISKNSWPCIFVDADVSDLELCHKICRLLENLGVGYSEPLRGSGPAETRKFFKKLVLDTDAFMIVYGNVPPTWVWAQGREIRKYLQQRKSPHKGFAIYEGPPEQKPMIPFKFPGMRFIQCRDCMDSTKIREFVELVTRGEISA